MVNYCEETLLALKRKKKIIAAVTVAAAFLCAAVCAVLCFFLNRENKIIIISVNSAAAVLGGWGAIAGIIVIASIKARLSLVGELMCSRRERITCKILKTGEKATIKRGISATVVTVTDGSERILYWEDALGECPFKAGDTAVLCISRNFIFSCEAEND